MKETNAGIREEEICFGGWMKQFGNPLLCTDNLGTANSIVKRKTVLLNKTFRLL
uniref:Uncharacterized protein n=1 Tax=Anguilla anguilla TaxID=7936 RepID=A0A0E9VIS3_ANGAN